MVESVSLAQKIYLLGIRPDKGGIIPTAFTAMDYCLLGALFLELYQKKNIEFGNKRIVLLSDKSDNELHLFILDKIKKSKRPLRISNWINKLYFSLKYIRKEIQKDLIEKKLIKLVSKRFLFFSWKKPYLLDKQFVSKLVSDVSKSIFGNTATESEIFMLAFVKPAGLLRRIFSERELRKKANKRINRIMKENQVSITVADAISAAKVVTAAVSATVSAHQAVT